MPNPIKTYARVALAGVALLLFLVVWAILCIQVWSYTPTPEQPRLPVPAFLSGVASFLAAAIATGLAAYLGIQIQKPAVTEQASEGWFAKLWKRLKAALKTKNIFATAIVIYVIVGVSVLLTAILSAKAPESLFETFAWTFVGFLVGSFTTVFSADGS